MTPSGSPPLQVPEPPQASPSWTESRCRGFPHEVFPPDLMHHLSCSAVTGPKTKHEPQVAIPWSRMWPIPPAHFGHCVRLSNVGANAASGASPAVFDRNG